jgi:hypothetical protein
MRERKIYICEMCGQEFSDYNDCMGHEFRCDNKKEKYKDNVVNVIHTITSIFGSLITDSTYNIEDDSFVDCDGDYIPCLHFNICFKLSNGNTVNIYDGMDEDLWLGNFLDEDVIFNSAKREIEKCIPTSFEGELRRISDDGWLEDYIGDLLISDIVNRLHGRKVRIEVIDGTNADT